MLGFRLLEFEEKGIKVHSLGCLWGASGQLRL